MLDLEIIDAHHHLQDLRLGYPWLTQKPLPDRYFGEIARLAHDYLVDDYLRDVGELRLVGSVHVENGARDGLAETRWLDELSRACGIPTVSVAAIDLGAPDAAERIEALAAFPTVRGVRQILNWHPDPAFTHTDSPGRMQDPRWRSGYARLAAAGLSFDMQVFAHQLDEVRELAGAFPDVPVVVNHAGMPLDQTPAGLSQWRAALTELARLDHVSVKISGLGTVDAHWTTESIRPLVLGVIEGFGVSRSMFASNFPVDGLRATFAGLYAAFDACTADFSRTERAALFADTARAIYRIPLPETTPAQPETEGAR